MNHEELAWAGGLFSGEGYTGQFKNYPRMTIGQKFSREVLDRFKNAVNLGRINGPYKEVWHYQATNFTDVQAIVAMLWPWLSTDKKNQAMAVLQSANSHSYRRKEVKHINNNE
jgi:hypothetical protein